MVSLKNNPVQMSCGVHEIPMESVDPQKYLCIAFAACIAKHLKRFYLFNDTLKAPFEITVDRAFQNDNDAFSIVLSCTYEDFDRAVKFAENLSEECYVSKSLKQTKIYEIVCNMHKHTFIV